MSEIKKCHCGVDKYYDKCCGMYHAGSCWPADPLSLMRSRYSAFVEGRVDYISKTMRDWACLDFNREATEKFCREVVWLGLEIVDYKYAKEQDEGQVEFVARFKKSNSTDDEVNCISERSLFKKVNGLWYYVSMVCENRL